MVTQLSPRQQALLRAVVEDYIETAEPVGSENIEKKYKLGVSPATIRNEMAELTELQYLKQPHTSAGRVPTAQGFKYYIQNLMEERDMPIREEVAVKEKLWDTRFQFDKLLRGMTRSLSESTGNLALATTREGDIFYSGAGQMLDMPEFYDIDTTKTVLSMLDSADELIDLFNRAVGEDPIKVLMGEELNVQYLEPIGFVFTHYDAGKNHTGVVGVVGPNRMAYHHVIPTLRYYGNLLTEMSHSW
jgi:heat-inducible transcriptional repressor